MDDLAGHWVGEGYQDNEMYTWTLDLIQRESDVYGTSKISRGQYYATMDISGSISNGILYFAETRIKKHKDPPLRYFFLKSAILSHSKSTIQVLEGTWKRCDSTPGIYARSGSIYLSKITTNESKEGLSVFEGALAAIRNFISYISR